MVKVFNNAELYIGNFSLALLVVILAMQVFFRYVLQTGISWSEEVSRFFFVWFVYISASLAAQKGSHIRVTILTRFFPGGQRYSLMLADAIWIIFNGFVAVSGVILLQRMMKHPVYSTSLFMPLAYIYTIIPVSHALMIVRIVQRQWIAWKKGTSVLSNEDLLKEDTGK